MVDQEWVGKLLRVIRECNWVTANCPGRVRWEVGDVIMLMGGTDRPVRYLYMHMRTGKIAPFGTLLLTELGYLEAIDVQKG